MRIAVHFRLARQPPERRLTGMPTACAKRFTRKQKHIYNRLDWKITTVNGEIGKTICLNNTKMIDKVRVEGVRGFLGAQLCYQVIFETYNIT